jgi:uncharacterized membrane protein YadS
VLVPLLAGALGLADRTAGLWAGLAVHDVAQVVAAAGAVSGVALTAAVVAKLARVVLLAPLVAGAGVVLHRSAPDDGRARPPVLPLFVVGFLLAVAVRSTGVLSDRLLTHASVLTTVLLAAAMVGLGAQVHVGRLLRTGARPLALGAVSTVVALGVSLGGLLLVT